MLKVSHRTNDISGETEVLQVFRSDRRFPHSVFQLSCVSSPCRLTVQELSRTRKHQVCTSPRVCSTGQLVTDRSDVVFGWRLHRTFWGSMIIKKASHLKYSVSHETKNLRVRVSTYCVVCSDSPLREKCLPLPHIPRH